jgi:hypothetical protein
MPVIGAPSITIFPSAGSADGAWTGDQMAKAKLEQTTKFVHVCFVMFYWFLFVFRFCWRLAFG